MSKPYETEADRVEARRKSYRDSKKRAKMAREDRRAYIADLLDRMLTSGSGSPERRAMLIQAEQNRRNAKCNE